jgi:hypothetical protein
MQLLRLDHDAERELLSVHELWEHEWVQLARSNRWGRLLLLLFF